VTGGGGGLGRVVAAALARAGADVAVTWAQDEDAAWRACGMVQAAGRRAVALHLDQTAPESAEAAVKHAADRLNGLDILVNNAGKAGGPPPGDLAAMTPEAWDEMIAVNLRGPFLVARAAAPFLRASGQGRIVNIGSVVGIGSAESAAAYTVSKAAVVPLTRYLATCLAPDVLVNCVAPGLMEGTGMSGSASEAYLETWKARSILGRTSSLEDVAAQVVACCATGSMTGQTILVDAGVHFH